MNNNPTKKMMQMITKHVDHNEYEHYLDEANLSVEELLALSSELYRLFSDQWETQQASNNHGINPFDVISLLEARVTILARTGDEGYADWMQEGDLAVRYLTKQDSAVSSTSSLNWLHQPRQISREKSALCSSTRVLSTGLHSSPIIGLEKMKHDRCGTSSWSTPLRPW